MQREASCMTTRLHWFPQKDADGPSEMGSCAPPPSAESPDGSTSAAWSPGRRTRASSPPTSRGGRWTSSPRWRSSRRRGQPLPWQRRGTAPSMLWADRRAPTREGYPPAIGNGVGVNSIGRPGFGAGRFLVLRRYYTSTILGVNRDCVGIILILCWHNTNTAYVLRCHRPGAAMVAYWYCVGTALAKLVHCTDTAPALHWHDAGFYLQCTGTETNTVTLEPRHCNWILSNQNPERPFRSAVPCAQRGAR